jgi:hypothetical protein
MFVTVSCWFFFLKFCDSSLLRWVGGGGQCGKKNLLHYTLSLAVRQCGKKTLLHCTPSLSPKVELWAPELTR